MAGGTELLAFADDDFKMRYREPYLTAGLNEKDVPKAPGLYRGFRLAESVTDMYVKIEADPDLSDHLAVYRSGTGYTLTVRKTGGDFELGLSAAASSTVYIALYLKYELSTYTEASLRAYTQAELDAAAEQGEVLILGVVDVPASGHIDPENISAAYRVVPADKQSSGEKAWHNIVRFGDLRGIMKQNTAQWTPDHRKVIPDAIVLSDTSGAAILKIDNSDGVSSGSSFALEFSTQDTSLQTLFSGQANLRPINKTVRVKLRFWYKVLLDATTPADHYVKFSVGYTRWSDGLADGEDLYELHFDTISAPQDWTLVEVEKELAQEVLFIRNISVLLYWPGAGSVYPAGQIYAKIADIQLLVEDEQVDVYGTIKEDESGGFGRVQTYAWGTPANEYDLSFGEAVYSYMYTPSVSMGGWRSYGFAPLEDPTSASRNIYGFHAPWVMGGEGLTSSATIGEIPRFRAKYDTNSGMTLLLEPQPPTMGTAPAFSRIYMDSHGNGSNFWFITNAMWKDTTGKWEQQDSGEMSFGFHLPEHAALAPKVYLHYAEPGKADWSKSSWGDQSWIGIHDFDGTTPKWGLQLGGNVFLGETTSGGSYEGELRIGYSSSPNIVLRTGSIFNDTSLSLENDRIRLQSPGGFPSTPAFIAIDTDDAYLAGDDGFYAPELALQSENILLQGEDSSHPVRLIMKNTDVVLQAAETGVSAPRLKLLDGNIVLQSEYSGTAAHLHLGVNDVTLRGTFGGVPAQLDLDNGNVLLTATSSGGATKAYLNLSGGAAVLSAGVQSPSPDPEPPYLSLGSDIWLQSQDPSGITHSAATLRFGSSDMVLVGVDPDANDPISLKFSTDDVVLAGAAPGGDTPYLRLGNLQVHLKALAAGSYLELEGVSAHVTVNAALGTYGKLTAGTVMLQGETILGHSGSYAYLDLQEYRGHDVDPVSNKRLYADQIVYAWGRFYLTGGATPTLGEWGSFNINVGAITIGTDSLIFPFRQPPGGSYSICVLAQHQNPRCITRQNLTGTYPARYIELEFCEPGVGYPGTNSPYLFTSSAVTGYVYFAVLTNPDV